MASVTIKDVARAAGVSASTVSRVISNHPKISPETRQKVREAMGILNYHPNIMAKSLASKNTRTLGIVLPHSAADLFINPFFSEVLRGMLAYANSKQYDLLLSSAYNEKEEVDAVTRMVLGHRVDGIILMTPRIEDPVVKKMLDFAFPFVILGRSLEYDHVLSVNNNNIEAAYDITNHLISQGHKKIGFVTGQPEFVVSGDRLYGYKKALAEANLAFQQEWVIHSRMLQQNSYHTIAMVMNLAERPTAFVVIDDVVAFGLIRELVEAGFQVPADVSIVGFNNIVLSELSNPPITTVDIGIYHLGYQTVQHLIRKLTGEVILQPQITVPHRLIIRESSYSR